MAFDQLTSLLDSGINSIEFIQFGDIALYPVLGTGLSHQGNKLVSLSSQISKHNHTTIEYYNTSH